MTPLVLASGSASRKALMEKLSLPFVTASPDIDESPHTDESPASLVIRLAEAKARAVAANFPQQLIVGSDQVCVINDKIIGKPLTTANAIAQLQAASGQKITFFTGLALLDARSNTLSSCCEEYRVHFRHLTDREVIHYIQQEQPLSCAGSFKAEGLGITLFSALEGRDPNTLVGLPLIALCDMLRQSGCDPLAPV
ncbi:MAG: Maf-like protein YceF [Candidatus Erwinia impunctatus]|nr:Maf-like protein YceF [Culicoides impunctatus]